MSETNIRYQFTKSNRLRKRNDILEVINSGTRIISKYLIIYFLIKDNFACRICISVSVKGRNNVQRNKLRRQVREIFRLNQHSFIDGLQLIVNVKNRIKEIDYKLLSNTLFEIFKKNKLLKSESYNNKS